MNTPTGAAGRASTDTGSACPFGPGRCTKEGRHHHDYEVHARYGTKRCQCGNRHYLITTGGPLPARVICSMCKKENWPASCYEAGRRDGPRRIEVPDAAAPF